MKDTVKIIVGSLLAVVLVLGFQHYNKVEAPTVDQSGQQVGSATGPDLYSPYFNVNGVRRWFTRTALTKATTTPCAIKSPAATSTLFFADLQVTTSTSTATTWTLAKAANAFATTTRFNVYSLSSGVVGTMIGTSTPTGVTAIVDDVNVIAPSQWIVWGVAGTAIADGTKLNGSCQAIFQEI